MADQTIIDRLRERAAKARRAVAECTDATSAPRPNHEDEDGHESYVPCHLCVSAVLNAQLMEDAADALTAAHAARDAAERDCAEITHTSNANFAAVADLRAQLTAALRERDEARAKLAPYERATFTPAWLVRARNFMR